MKLGTIPDNLAERIALWTGILPPGVFESWFGIMLSRTIMVATRVNVFEALAAGPLTAAEVAEHCDLHPLATEKLLNALVGLECLSVRGELYALRKSLREWVLEDGKHSFRGQILLHFLEWRWWEQCEEYIRTGRPLDVHQTMDEEEWGIYQRGMRSGIEMPAEWVARNLPLPEGARQMLDIGGGHGYFSVALCRRHPQLLSTILDLPEAVRHAAPLLEREGMGDRIRHREGDLLTEKLGTETYDLIFMAAVVHHFDGPTNHQLMERIARALKPGGLVAVWEPVRQNRGGRIRQIGGLLDLFFGFFSQAGTWSAEDIADWMHTAGLEPVLSRSPRLMPDLALHVGHRSLEPL